MKLIKMMNYQGNKLHFSNKFNELVSELEDVKYYVEPFVGSGAILFNLKKEYDKYIINDINKEIISIYNSIKKMDFKEYLNTIEFIMNTYGDLRIKENFYNYRNFYNKTFHSTDKDEKGLFLLHLANSCINSMLRFGPNGMNSSFGKRWFKIDEYSYDKIKYRLSNTIIENMDFKDFVKKYDNDKNLIFMDPPYFERPTSYVKNFTNNENLIFLNFIKNVKGKIVYTDIYNDEIAKILKWEYENINIIRNSSPNRKNEETFQEVAFYNFEKKNNKIEILF
jgi:DNA adenine methylase Dam